MSRLPETFNGEFEEYTGDRVASLAPDEELAYSRIRDNFTNDNYGDQSRDMLTKAFGSYGQAPTGEQLDAYTNPYDEAVTERVIGDIDERYLESDADLRAALAQGGSFGGSGTVLERQRLRADTEDLLGDTLAEQRAASYDKAFSRYTEDQDRLLSGGLSAFNLDRANTSDLERIGSQERLLDQMDLDFEYSEFDRAREREREDTAAMAQIGYSYPTHLFDTTATTTNKTTQNPLQTLIGVGSMAAGAFTGNPQAIAGGASVLSGSSGDSTNLSALMAQNNAALQAKQASAVQTGGLYADGGLVTTEAPSGPNDPYLEYEEPAMSGLETYFSNPLTKLGIDLLSADSVGSALKSFSTDLAADREAQRRREKEKADRLIELEARKHRRGREEIGDQRYEDEQAYRRDRDQSRDALNMLRRQDSLAAREQSRLDRQTELQSREERQALEDRAALLQSRHSALAKAFAEASGNEFGDPRLVASLQGQLSETEKELYDLFGFSEGQEDQPYDWTQQRQWFDGPEEIAVDIDPEGAAREALATWHKQQREERNQQEMDALTSGDPLDRLGPLFSNKGGGF